MIMVFKIAGMNVWGCAACTAVNPVTDAFLAEVRF